MWTLRNQISWLTRAQWTLGALMLLMVAAFYVLGYRPQTQRLASLNEQVRQQQRELVASQTQTKILPDVASEVERLKARLDRFKSMPKQQELPQFIKDIAQLGQQASLKKFDLKPGTPARDDRFNELPIKLEFEGDFVNVFSFLRHTEELQRLTRVRGMTIKGRDRQGQVKVQLTMNIYFATE